MTRSFVMAAVVALAASSLSCSLLRHDKAAAARPKTPRPFAPPPAKVQEPAPVIELPVPDMPPEQVDVAELPPLDLPGIPPYRPRRQRQPRPREAVEIEPEPSKSAIASVPQLEQILTPAQQQEYTRAIDRNLGRAQRTVELLSTRRLNSEQRTYMDRIKEFIQQAEDARKNDLVRAKNLAERAGVLAEDLIRTVP